MPKQDRVAPRTAEDIERRTNYRQTFGEFAGLVDEAKKAAADAELAAKNVNSAVNNLDEKLDQDEIFNRLTNDGEVQGIYRAEDGQIYINASYIAAGELLADLIKAGVLKSKDGTISLDLSGNELVIGTSATGQNGMRFKVGGLYGYMNNIPILNLYTTLAVASGEKIATLASMNGASLELFAMKSSDGTSGAVKIGTANNTVKVQGKTVSWKANGDGTYTLIGTD
jgi:hypothetical protein